MAASPPTALPPAGSRGPDGAAGEAPPARAGALLGYAPLPGVHDEMMAPDGSVRAPWRGFIDRVLGMPARDLQARWDKARHLLHENGVSYNVYGDPRGMERPWSLSPVPVLVGAAEWAALSEGVAQR